MTHGKGVVLMLAAFVPLGAGASGAGQDEPGPAHAVEEAFRGARGLIEQLPEAIKHEARSRRGASEENAQSRADSGAGGIENWTTPENAARAVWPALIFAAVSLLPVALLVLTAFVRISVVLLLVRQALGSPQIPGNQVMTALALLLTVLVMAPVAQRVHREGIAPYMDSRKNAEDAWRACAGPIKEFMGDQIIKSKHQHYLWVLHGRAFPESMGNAEPRTIEEFPMRVVAPAFLISELTTALYMGFAIFLPFLVVDLVVSAVLSSMGLFLLPPPLVALPIKLVLFVLADGWMLVADTLVRSFA